MKGSLRARLFVGALAWMTAVFVAVTALLLKMTRDHPELALPRVTYHTAIGLTCEVQKLGVLAVIKSDLLSFIGHTAVS